MVLGGVEQVLMFRRRRGGEDVYISGRENNKKLKFSMYTHLTQTNTTFEYWHTSVNLDNYMFFY